MEITGIFHRTSCHALHKRPFRLVLVVLVLSDIIWPVSGPTVADDRLCSRIESSTVTYRETHQVSRSRKTTTKCGFWDRSRCTAYRTVYVTETRDTNREIYNVVYFCCNGGAILPNGSCRSNSTDPTTATQSQATSSTLLVAETTPSTSAEISPDLESSFWSSDGHPSFPTKPPASAPGEIAKPKDPGPLGKGGNSKQDSPSGDEHYGVIGGVVGVVAALVVMAALTILFISRRKRRQRDKREESDPGVVFQLLNANSPATGPSPDIYTEIPDREANASPIPGGTSSKDLTDGYSLSFVNIQQSPAHNNTYQDVREPGSRPEGTRIASGMLPTTTNLDAEVHLTENGVKFTKPRNDKMVTEVGSPYQNVPELNEDAPEPDIYDMIAVNGSISAVDNPKPVIPVDPDNEVYNMIVIGPNDDGKSSYDKLERKRGGSKASMDGQLDLPIPAVNGYSALGADTHHGYDKLARHETHPVDPERKPGTLQLNTYDELAAQQRTNDYDKLARRGSDDRGLRHSGTSSGIPKSLPNGASPQNEYDSVVIETPADGEIYGNLPKKPIQKKLAIRIPPPKLKSPQRGKDSNDMFTSPPVMSHAAARPVYDVIPGSTRAHPSPVYDILPKSPDPVGVVPVYDIPPALKTLHSVSSEDEGPTEVDGARPVYDTPPVRTNNACPLQFTETSPVYENTPTRRN